MSTRANLPSAKIVATSLLPNDVVSLMVATMLLSTNLRAQAAAAFGSALSSQTVRLMQWPPTPS